ncbi:MAG: glycosyltransferase family 39 protein [Bacteroidia bacterium]|nr:glycosyltransferase family 39 protein [Bacteroidia bacterium]
MIYISFTLFDFPIFRTNFTSTDLVYLFVGFLFVVGSIICFLYDKHKTALISLFMGAFILRLLMAFIDPYIQLWDEQFHALVAYNMMDNPFHPMLYKTPVLPFDYRNWTSNHIWLHKQPLFLWQMALAMKIFGVSPLSIRLPSVILSSLIVPAIYRIGSITMNKRVGFLSALFISVSNIHINIVSGFLNTDQNDAVFLCYVTFSLWAWTEYNYSGKKYWLLFIGLFAGMAILVKWLVGFLVYFGWVVSLIVSEQKRKQIRYWKEICISLAITLIIALPWQLYVYFKWPLENIEETKQNMQHFSDNFDHTGPWWYHLSLIQDQYGLFFMLLLIGGMVLFLKSSAKIDYKWAYMSNIIFVYTFFALIPTRMPFFCFCVSGLLVFIAAFGLESFFIFINKYITYYFRIFLCVTMIAISLSLMNIDRLEHFHTDRNKGDFYRQARIWNLSAYKKTKLLLVDSSYVVFNCPKWNAVSFMFYNGNTAYETIPTLEQYNFLKKQNIPIAIFNDTPLPEYLTNDFSVIKIPYKLIRNGF